MIALFQALPYVVKLIIGINLLLTGYMWVGQPVVIDMPFPDSFHYAGFCTGFLIVMNTNDVYTQEHYNVVLKHEYTHYIQHAIYTPLGSSLYSLYRITTNLLKYGIQPYDKLYYTDNYFENQAYDNMFNSFFKLPAKYLRLKLDINW